MGFPEGEPDCNVSCTAPGLVCGEQAQELHLTVYLLPFAKHRPPTAGFQAFFTFAPICMSIDLYGFGGLSNVDNHLASTGIHNYTAEHIFFDRLCRGEIRDGNGRYEGKI